VLISVGFAHRASTISIGSYKRPLFGYGYNLGRQGCPWKKASPGLEVPVGS